MKIALRFLITKNSNVDWVFALSTLQFRLNNNINVIIEKSLNELITKIKSKKIIIVVIEIEKKISIVIVESTDIFAKNRFVFQKKVADTTSFVVVKVKLMYNARHQSLKLNLDDEIYLRLHYDYSLSSKFNVKLSN